MKKIIKLTESDLVSLVRKVIKEQSLSKSTSISNKQSCLAMRFSRKSVEQRLSDLYQSFQGLRRATPEEIQSNSLMHFYKNNLVFFDQPIQGPFVFTPNGGNNEGRVFLLLDDRDVYTCPVIYLSGKGYYIMDDKQFSDLKSQIQFSLR